MDYMTYIARIAGPILAIICFWNLIYRHEVSKLVDSMKKTPSIYYVGNLFYMLLGLIIIVTIPYFTGGLAFFIPLLGWFLFIRSIITLFFPAFFSFLYRYEQAFIVISSFLGLIWGILIFWYGYLL